MSLIRMFAKRRLAVLGLILSPWLVACDSGNNKVPVVPSFTDSHLQQGRAIWMQVCRNCHLMGVSGAPGIDDPVAWVGRLPRGDNALYLSAVSGVWKGEGWSMPPRGGRPELSYDEITAAADFMLAAVRMLELPAAPAAFSDASPKPSPEPSPTSAASQ